MEMKNGMPTQIKFISPLCGAQGKFTQVKEASFYVAFADHNNKGFLNLVCLSTPFSE